MGVKKPAVIAKTAAKKRGRPVGSKNKPKVLSSEGWVPGKPVDWEHLAKQLQEALATQIRENERLEFILLEYKSVIRLDSSFTFWDRLAFLFTGKINGNKSV